MMTCLSWRMVAELVSLCPGAMQHTSHLGSHVWQLKLRPGVVQHASHLSFQPWQQPPSRARSPSAGVSLVGQESLFVGLQ